MAPLTKVDFPLCYFVSFVVNAFGCGRPLRNAIPIRNVLRRRISRDWRSLSRLRGLRTFLCT